MPRADERAQRLSARRKAKAALEPLRALVRALAEWDRLEGADAVGVVTIRPDEEEARYAADLLDIVARAVEEAGREQVVEVFVTLSAAEPIHSASRIGDEACPARDSTQTSAPRSASRDPSLSVASRTTPGA